MVSMEEGMRKAYGQDYVWVLCEDRFEIPVALSDHKQPISYPISPQKKLTSASSKDIVLRVKIYETPHLCRDLTLFGYVNIEKCFKLVIYFFGPDHVLQNNYQGGFRLFCFKNVFICFCL